MYRHAYLLQRQINLSRSFSFSLVFSNKKREISIIKRHGRKNEKLNSIGKRRKIKKKPGTYLKSIEL